VVNVGYWPLAFDPVEYAPRPIATSLDVAKAGLQNLVGIGDAIFDERVEAPETAGSAYSAATPQA
jgi:hypothetical protein